MVEYYDFRNAEFDVKSLIHAINLQGNDLVGLELGILRAESFCTLLQNCPKIKTLYGVDSWKPYTDILLQPYSVSDKQQEMIKFIAYHNIKYSGYQHKAIILEKDSNQALSDIPDNHLDFIFLDAYMNYEQVKNDLTVWYPKVKPGGLFTGHDYNSVAVQKGIEEFRKQHNITTTLSVFDQAWAWRKNVH